MGIPKVPPGYFFVPKFGGGFIEVVHILTNSSKKFFKKESQVATSLCHSKVFT
jgi:hypothetical protein